jgi:hypothetical protein
MLENAEGLIRVVTPGMEVSDVSGEKVGKVDRVRGEIIDVKTGPFGLGKHLYVPPSSVDGVTEAGVILRHAKHEFHEVGLDARPPDLSS